MEVDVNSSNAEKFHHLTISGSDQEFIDRLFKLFPHPEGKTAPGPHRGRDGKRRAFIKRQLNLVYSIKLS